MEGYKNYKEQELEMIQDLKVITTSIHLIQINFKLI